MSVLINEIEIVPPPAAEAGAEAPAQRAGESQEGGGRLTAGDVLTLVRNRERRQARLWAH